MSSTIKRQRRVGGFGEGDPYRQHRYYQRIIEVNLKTGPVRFLCLKCKKNERPKKEKFCEECKPAARNS